MNVSQRIPNLLKGISQQPDEKKFLGQLRECKNAYPDYTNGLMKKPGEKFIATLKDATPDGKWFSILRDKTEKYVGQYSDNAFKIWSVFDGTPRKVDMGSNTGIPGACNYANVQTTLLAYNAAVSDVQAKLTLLQQAEAVLAETTDGQQATYVNLFETSFTFSSTVDESVVSGVIYNPSTGVYTVKENNTIVTPVGTTLPTNYSLGPERTDEHPIFAANGLKVYESVKWTPATFTSGQLTTATNNYNTALTNYNNAVSTLSTATSNYNAEIAACSVANSKSGTYVRAGNQVTCTINGHGLSNGQSITVDFTSGSATDGTYTVTYVDANNFIVFDSASGSTSGDVTFSVNSYLKGATAEDLELLTLTDYTFVLNKKKVVAMDPATSSVLPKQGFVVVSIVANTATYYVIIKQGGSSYSYSYTTPAVGTALDVDTITTALVTAINGGTGSHGVTAVKVGPGISLTGTSTFSVETRGSNDKDGIYCFQDAITSAGKLPLQCKNGYVVKVSSSEDIEADDYWVKFTTQNNESYGTGTWEETIAPGLTYKFDPLTMPHQLVRQSDGSFKFQPVNWNDRLVGDNTTNPIPTFVGKTISGIFFYRDRLGFLSDDTVVMSRAGRYFNFFGKSATAVTDDDPIDISVASIEPIIINYVQPVSVGLVLFGQTQQFILTTDSDILGPKTAKINNLSSYEADINVKAKSLGTTVGFISKSDLHTKLFELVGISVNAPPAMNDTSRIVPELMPSTIDDFIVSPSISVAAFGEFYTKDLTLYRFLNQGVGANQQRVSDAWFQWELTNNLLHQFFDFSVYFYVGYTGTDVHLTSIDLTGFNQEGRLTLSSGESTDPDIDMWYLNPHRTYNSGTDKTRIYLPYNHISGRTIVLLQLSDYIGSTSNQSSVGQITYPTVAGTAGNYYVELDGDYRGRDIIVGYIFEMLVELPTFYVTRESDNSSLSYNTSDLILHRVKVTTGMTGPITYRVKVKGIQDRDLLINTTLPYDYLLDSVNIARSTVHTVPLYQRNKNITFQIYSNSPLPATISTLTWEGKFNNRSYRSA